MKRALIVAAAVAAAALATPALAQADIRDPGYRMQFYPRVNCQNLGPGNSCADGAYRQNGTAMNLDHGTASAEFEPYRYHGGPKSND